MQIKNRCETVDLQHHVSLKGHCHEHNFKNSAAQKYVYTIGNLLIVVKFSFLFLLNQCTEADIE